MSLQKLDSFPARLRQALDEAGYADANPRELGRIFGVSGQAVRKWLNGDSLPTHARLEQLSASLGVRRAWLLDGESPMRQTVSLLGEEPPDRYKIPGEAAFSLSQEEFHLILSYRRLPKALRETLQQLLVQLDTKF